MKHLLKTSLLLVTLSLYFSPLRGMADHPTDPPTDHPTDPPTDHPTDPVIESVSMTESNLVIQVRVVEGYARLIYETKVNLKSTAAWIPRKSMSLSGAAEVVELTVEQNPEHGCFRVRCFTEQTVDRKLFQGTSSFPPQASVEGFSTDTPGNSGGAFTGANISNTGVQGANVDMSSAPDVLDSNVWSFKGNRLYYFNQYRGLQIIDISNADVPELVDTLELPLSGERMFTLPESDHVILLAAMRCNSSLPSLSIPSVQEQQVLVLDVEGDHATVIDALPVPGSITESRLIGHSLFVGSTGYFPHTSSSNTTWETRTYLTSFNLQDPDNAAQVDQLSFSGYAGAVRAFPDHIAMVTHNWFRGKDSGLVLVDIDHESAQMSRRLELDSGGRIPNEYMINLQNDVLSVFVDDLDRRISRLSNYDMAGNLLGTAEVGLGERLFSARFDGDIVYAVTFRRIDPLWIIDNSDPALPIVTGELEVPGFSTYIEPLDEQILTIGSVSGQVAVSLFDTSDLTQPNLLSRITLGERYSWSEAQYEEQAFQVDTDTGLILIPFYAAGASGLQFIELGPTNLVERGIVLTPQSVRRSAVQSNRVFAITGEELLTIDPSIPDHPVLSAQLELARRVGQIVLHDNYLIEIDSANSYFWGGGSPSPVQLRSRSISNDHVMASIELEALNLLGVEKHGDLLYLLQGDNHIGWYCCFISDGSAPAAPSSNIICSVIDLTALPEIRVVGQDTSLSTNRPSGNQTALWPDEQTLVWAPENVGSTIWGYSIGWAIYPGFYSSKQLLAYDVSTNSSPRLVSQLLLPEASSTRFDAADGKVFGGQRTFEFIPTTNTSTNSSMTVYQSGQWYTTHSLTVIDYQDTENPVIRPPADLMGDFVGISTNGRICFTTERGEYDHTNATWSASLLHAFAYDDVALFHIDSLNLGGQSGSYQQSLVHKDLVYIQGYTNSSNELWTCALDVSNRWTVHDRQPNLKWSTFLIRNDLFIQHNWTDTLFFNLHDPLHPELLHPQRTNANCFNGNPKNGDGSSATGYFHPNGLFSIDHWRFN